MSLRIHFRHCSPKHEEAGSLLRRLVEEACGTSTTVVRNARQADLVLASDRLARYEKAARWGTHAARHFQGRLIDSRADARHAVLNDQPPPGVPSIWFTQENSRPPSGPWTGYLSFDLDPLDGRNAYFPSWWWLLDLLGAPGVDHFLGRSLTVEEMLLPRGVDPEKRQGFVCAFINNPTPMRLHAIRALQRVGPVDIFGRAAGRPVGSKMHIAKRYRFFLCFENDLYPGYVTEKPFEAWATGAIPLWWGDDPAGYLNQRALLNLATIGSLEDMVERVIGIESAHSWDEVASEPLLTRAPDAEQALEVVARAVSRVL